MRRYESTHFDSPRWARFALREGDIVIATPYKSGTTWMQNIILHLIHQDFRLRSIPEISPWLEVRFRPFEPIRDIYEAQGHRRAIKSHLGADALPLDSPARFVFVGRDPRDAFMSLWNHYTNMMDRYFEPPEDPRFPAMPRPPASILDFWDGWIGRGFVEGETDGYPFWSFFRQARTWWEVRHRPDVHFAHYADMLTDLKGEIARVAAFAGIGVGEAALEKITDLCTFASMKRDATVIDTASEEQLVGGARAFINKGTNGRWREVLDEARLAEYERVAARALPPDCKRWLEEGGRLP